MEFKITNVGIAGDSLINDNGVITGRGVVYSRDLDPMTLDLEYQDEFEFRFEEDTEFIVVKFINDPEDIFGEFIEEIEAKLIDNLKTNFI